jgi:hypothetical protein
LATRPGGEDGMDDLRIVVLIRYYTIDNVTFCFTRG